MSKSAVKIANISGSIFDRIGSMKMLLSETKADVITGDWLSEINLATLALEMQADPSLGYERAFYDCLALALDEVVKGKVRVVSNAGGLNPSALCTLISRLVEERGYNLQIAYIDGDNLQASFADLRTEGKEFRNLDTGALFPTHLEPVAANAYLGGWGIAEALKRGADIVITGRVTDAAPVIGASAWWHGWERQDYDALAGALVAGHLIECSCYVTGGNFPGFKHIGNLASLGYPIAEISADGTSVITKGDESDGVVTSETVTTQLLYELQGRFYVNPDVTADLAKIEISNIAKNRVKVSSITGIAPPATAKVGVSCKGGYAAEVHWFLVGLDIQQKLEMIRLQAERILDPTKFLQLRFDAYGSVPDNPKSQREATVHVRVFAQAKDEETLSPNNFLRVLINNTMQSYPGATCNYDFRLGYPREFIEYWPTLLDTRKVSHRVHLQDGEMIEILPAFETASVQQESHDPDVEYDELKYGELVEAPLGSIVFGRSGDKFTNSNVGLFVRHDDEWEWLRSFMTIGRMRELLADDDINGVIERVEFPRIRAVHFLNRGLLGKGVSSTGAYDALGKNVAEYLRCKKVLIPKLFFDRGQI